METNDHGASVVIFVPRRGDGTIPFDWRAAVQWSIGFGCLAMGAGLAVLTLAGRDWVGWAWAVWVLVTVAVGRLLYDASVPPVGVAAFGLDEPSLHASASPATLATASNVADRAAS